MNKTTVYFPDELARAASAAGRRRQISEAEVIRQPVAVAVADEVWLRWRVVFSSDLLMSDDVDTQLVDFGER